jgi:hypothetical protein
VSTQKPLAQAILDGVGVSSDIVAPAEASVAQASVGQEARRNQVKRMIRNAKRKQAIPRRKKAKRERAQKAKMKKNGPKRAQSAFSIFADEMRPTITEAACAKGGDIDAADVVKQIAVLWQEETDQAKYYHAAEDDKVRYADEKTTFAFEGDATLATEKRRPVASVEDGAQAPPARRDVVPPHWASELTAAVASVYSSAVGFLQPFLSRVEGLLVDLKLARNQRTRWAALQLMAAGRGPLRATTCNHTLRVVSGETAQGQALLRRALLLLGPGELQELHELRLRNDTVGTCDFILSMLEQEAVERVDRNGRLRDDGPVSRALASLRLIKGENVTLPLALIAHCAATLTTAST